jgi:hypothetical protein
MPLDTVKTDLSRRDSKNLNYRTQNKQVTQITLSLETVAGSDHLAYIGE